MQHKKVDKSTYFLQDLQAPIFTRLFVRGNLYVCNSCVFLRDPFQNYSIGNQTPARSRCWPLKGAPSLMSCAVISWTVQSIGLFNPIRNPSRQQGGVPCCGVRPLFADLCFFFFNIYIYVYLSVGFLNKPSNGFNPFRISRVATVRAN